MRSAPKRLRENAGRRPVLLVIGLAIALVATACAEGSDSSITTGSSSSSPPAPSSTDGASEVTTTTVDSGQPAATTADGHIVVSHQNVPQARRELDAARQRWTETGLESYGLSVRIACECDMWQSEAVLLEGETIDSRFLFQPEFADESDIPGTVEDLFVTADQLLAALEANPENVAREECDGIRFGLVVDANTGFPYEFGNDSPCDGGATWISSLIPMGDAPPARIDVDAYTGIDLDHPQIVPGAVDGLVVLTAHGFSSGDDPEAMFRTEFGMPCGGAEDEATCRAAVDAHLTDPIGAAVFSYQCPMCLGQHVALVATDGDEVRLVTRDDLAKVLGRIDTAEEAVLVADASGVVRKIDDEWEILSNQVIADCAPIIERGALLRVTEDGLVYEADHWFNKFDDVCI